MPLFTEGFAFCRIEEGCEANMCFNQLRTYLLSNFPDTQWDDTRLKILIQRRCNV